MCIFHFRLSKAFRNVQVVNLNYLTTVYDETKKIKCLISDTKKPVPSRVTGFFANALRQRTTNDTF